MSEAKDELTRIIVEADQEYIDRLFTLVSIVFRGNKEYQEQGFLSQSFLHDSRLFYEKLFPNEIEREKHYKGMIEAITQEEKEGTAK